MTYRSVFPTSEHHKLFSRYRWAFVVKVDGKPGQTGVARTKWGAERAATRAEES